MLRMPNQSVTEDAPESKTANLEVEKVESKNP